MTASLQPPRPEPHANGRPALLPTGTLDGVRGLAALYVLLYHARILLLLGSVTAVGLHVTRTTRLALAGLDLLLGHGHAAVLAFFLVSGYAIHYRQAVRLATEPDLRVSWPLYAARRIRRLYPPLLAALALTFALDSLGSRLNPGFYAGKVPAEMQIVALDQLSRTWTAFVGTLLFVQQVATPLFGSDRALWSLAYEGFYYVTYPLVLAVNRRHGPLPCLAAFLGIGLASASLLAAGLDAGLLHLLAYWPMWVGGVFLADARAGRVRVPGRWWAGAALVSPLLLLPIVAMRHAPQAAGAGDALWALMFFCVFGWLIAIPHAPAFRARLLRGARPLFALGAMSYSLYIVHLPVLELLSAAWLRGHGSAPLAPWLLGVGVVAALLVAVAVHLAVERPILARRADQAKAEAAAPAVPDLRRTGAPSRPALG